ncbi:MAG: GNAT family N-acetyltransferase [Deltaproteobacteria bacterium]|nr:MAG: GNAT family N-acetyltransferase [Deltaproteobacteria bacterium]
MPTSQTERPAPGAVHPAGTAVVPASGAAVALRAATPADCEYVWQINNAPDVRAVSVDPRPIPFDEHRRWFTRALSDPSASLAVICRDGEPAGVVPVHRARDGAAVVSIALDPAHRGAGIGRAAVAAACRAYARRHPGVPIDAWIHPDNRASAGCFRAAGFSWRACARRAGRTWHVYRWTEQAAAP